ncbi:MAG: methyltransferase domain-containing protein [Gemmatimonadetes bacterium]|jgi:SAM-dependent methyltransferase|nr:methyltransferase domain-containing protein [Gemmatimonadota bacterium]MBT7915209.1 methyltransferase domain-containing protein [Candidatus Bathyarchaeota archaeon]
MATESTDLRRALELSAYPRSAKYDPQWLIDTRMGPNSVWLMESLCEVMSMQSGMRVLDMGCGMAASSIFLAREFDVEVWACDLWIDPSENWERICRAGLERQVYPLKADARSLPFARGFFDASVSVDAYHYFGTDDLFIGCYADLIKAEGQIGIVVPGLVAEIGEAVPSHLKPYWEWEFRSFHSAEWWRRHWEKTERVRVERADMIPDGWRHWLLWNEVYDRQVGREGHQEAKMLRADDGRNFGFVRLTARTSNA